MAMASDFMYNLQPFSTGRMHRTGWGDDGLEHAEGVHSAGVGSLPVCQAAALLRGHQGQLHVSPHVFRLATCLKFKRGAWPRLVHSSDFMLPRRHLLSPAYVQSHCLILSSGFWRCCSSDPTLITLRMSLWLIERWAPGCGTPEESRACPSAASRCHAAIV